MSMTNVAGLSKTAASRNFIQNESSRYTSTGENSRVSLVESLLVFATVGGRSRTRPVEYCSSKENTPLCARRCRPVRVSPCAHEEGER